MYHIWIRRQAAKPVLGYSRGLFNSSLHLRLFMLSGVDLLITIPFNTWVFTTWFPVHPWMGWTAVHSEISHVFTLSITFWWGRPELRHVVEGVRWISVVYGLVFFLLFGFTDEAMGCYTSILQYIAKKIGYQTKFSGSSEYVIGLELLQNISHFNLISFAHADLECRNITIYDP